MEAMELGTFYTIPIVKSWKCCNFSIGKLVGFTATGMPLIERYFHATGSSSSAKQSYYEILGVPKNATCDEIKKAYHALAKKYHPDANKNNPSAKRKFQEITDANETLQDSEKRRGYDSMHTRSSENMEYGANDAQGFRFYDASGAQGFRYTYRTNFSDSFSKIFCEIFQEEMDQFAPDIQTEPLLSFSEAARGCTKDLCFEAFVPCDSCNGCGYPLNAKVKICPTCRGTGTVTIPPFTSTCNSCKGSGRIIREYCISCQGSGIVEGVKEVKVTIPAGRQMILSLLEMVQKFISTLILALLKEAFVLRKIFTALVCVPSDTKGCQHGQLMVLRGKGLPKHGFLVHHGDQYVCFHVNLPTAINDQQRAILEELAKEEINNENDSTTEGNWWETILEYVTGPKFMVEFSLLLLVLLFLKKTMG